MRSFSMHILLCLLIMGSGARAGSAQEVQPLDPEWLQRMYAEGWEKVQEGVLWRTTEGEKYETFSYGAEGLQWVVLGYERQLDSLEERYYAFPSEELAQVIHELREHIDQLNGDLVVTGSSDSFDGELLETCSFSYDAYADAGPLESPRGVTAVAWATWSNTCNYLGSTFAYAFANAIDGPTQTTVTQINPPVYTEATAMESYSTATAYGSTDCRAEAQAEVRVPALGIVHQTLLDQQYGCPSGVTASISGPALVTTDFYTSSCKDVTWTASATGGTPGYTYQWSINSSPAGSGAILRKRYCETDAQLDVRVVAQDANGWTGPETFQTELQHIGPLGVILDGPGQVTTNSTTPCVNVTWTASATEGHPGYTYQWYTGTGTTAEGTGSTFVKQYCNTNETVTVRVVATDTDGHTVQGAEQTIITHIAPLTVSINDPGTVTTDYYASSCADVTWTANAAGGTAPYTYEWSINATPAGSGATLTKRYCEMNASLSVKVVVRDANGSTVDATVLTQLRHIGPLTAAVNGPSQATTSATTGCVDVTWTTSVQGGHPGYTYQWYMGIGSPVVGTDSSYTQRFCSTETVTMRVVVRDSDGHTVEGSKQTQIIGAPVVTISGPGTVTYDYYTSTCTDVTWTASVTGGSPAFTYKWYVGSGTTVQGTGATFTKRYCDTNGSVSVRVVVTDSRSLTDDATFTNTTLRYRAPIVASISAPSSVSTSTTPVCMDVTWTASATSSGGNHSGFTYSWYIGTTLQGSGSTLTKRYCSAQPVTVKLVAKASDNHTDEDTRTSTVGPTSPAPTISGPTEVYLAYLPQCQDVTWTVSTTGGTSPYTYSWYVGTTLVGSGTSYTKSYCRTNQTVNLKVVARDSGGRTGEDLHTTYVYYEDPYTCVVQEDPGSSNTNAPVNPCN